MSSFSENTANSIVSDITGENFLIANYGDFTIFSTTVTRPTEEKNQISLQYGNSNTYLTYSLSTPSMPNKNYYATNMYITGILHNNINGVTPNSNYVGELIIEHSNSNDSSKIFNCYILSSSSSANPNKLDNFISTVNSSSTTPTEQFNLNTLIKTNNLFLYKDNANLVIVNTNPITINNDSANYITSNLNSSKTDLFSTTPPQQYYNISNFSVGESDKIYIDCNPTGESSATIGAYNVPINSEYTNGKDQLAFMNTTTNFYVFTVFIVVAYLFVPIIYKELITKNIINHLLKGGNANVFLKYSTGSDILILILLTFLIWFLVTAGTKSVAMFFGFFIILSTTLISSHKINTPDSRRFLQDDYKQAYQSMSYGLFEIFGYIMIVLNALFINIDGNYHSWAFYAFAIFMFLILLLCLVATGQYIGGKLDSFNILNASIIYMMFLVAIFLVLMIYSGKT
jgi:hypothetical protein